MTKDEAIEQLKLGKKLTHLNFTNEEFFFFNEFELIEFEDGVMCSQTEFWKWRTVDSWNDGYSIYNPN